MIAILLLALAAAPVHLDSPVDREAFRRWFTLLSESRYYSSSSVREITDCAALVRWSVRQALVRHDSTWAKSAGLPVLAAMPSVQQRLVDPNLFLTGEKGSAQFADANTLRRYNTYFISREMRQAKPGDLLFYRQFERKMPVHVMIYIGASQFQPAPQRWIVYHTGPGGEIRKVSVEDLLAHSSPEWRPTSGNTNFLGVWRLNLLSD